MFKKCLSFFVGLAIMDKYLKIERRAQGGKGHPFERS